MSGNEDTVAAAIRDSGLIAAGSRGVVLLSGGPDSVALLAGLVAFSPGLPPVALHLNYGLRQESGDDQAVAGEVCERLGVELVVVEAGHPERNVQAWARDLRYSAAENLRLERGADWVAVGHTSTDVAETVIYRLVSSPGRRALAAMDERRGAIVRPLLGMSRSDTRAYVESAGLPFALDSSNHDPAFTRVRIRNEVMPVLEGINSAAETNIVRTRAELLEEGELLEDLAASLLQAARGDGLLSAGPLAESHPVLARLALRQFAEESLGRQVPLTAERARTVMRLGLEPEGGSVDLGGGDSFRIESGRIGVAASGERIGTSPVANLDLPGTTSWRGWQLAVRLADPPFEPAGSDVAMLDLDVVGGRLTVRAWLPGDRIQPLGMEGSKTLQDLFTDSRVERSRRRQIPVLLRDDEVVWVAGIAVAHRFRLTGKTKRAVVVTATPGHTS